LLLKSAEYSSASFLLFTPPGKHTGEKGKRLNGVQNIHKAGGQEDIPFYSQYSKLQKRLGWFSKIDQKGVFVLD
jgi:hypothetical protein